MPRNLFQLVGKGGQRHFFGMVWLNGYFLSQASSLELLKGIDFRNLAGLLT